MSLKNVLLALSPYGNAKGITRERCATWTKNTEHGEFKTPPRPVGRRRLMQNKLASCLYDSPVLLPDYNTTL